MSLLAIKDYARQVIEAVSIPNAVTQWRAIKVYRQMPKMSAPLGSNCVVIIGNVDLDETRKTLPRGQGVEDGSGAKEIVYTVPFLLHANATNERERGDQWDVLVEAVIDGFRTANTGIPITDPLTSVDSWLHSIGEHIKGRQLTPIEVAIEGTEATQVNFEYIMTVTFKEWINR